MYSIFGCTEVGLLLSPDDLSLAGGGHRPGPRRGRRELRPRLGRSGQPFVLDRDRRAARRRRGRVRRPVRRPAARRAAELYMRRWAAAGDRASARAIQRDWLPAPRRWGGVRAPRALRRPPARGSRSKSGWRRSSNSRRQGLPRRVLHDAVQRPARLAAMDASQGPGRRRLSPRRPVRRPCRSARQATASQATAISPVEKLKPASAPGAHRPAPRGLGHGLSRPFSGRAGRSAPRPSARSRRCPGWPTATAFGVERQEQEEPGPFVHNGHGYRRSWGEDVPAHAPIELSSHDGVLFDPDAPGRAFQPLNFRSGTWAC